MNWTIYWDSPLGWVRGAEYESEEAARSAAQSYVKQYPEGRKYRVEPMGALPELDK
jgi:hypothetical protein